jgi:transposase
VIDKLLASPPPNSIVLSFDEKGKTPIKRFSGKRWTNDKHYRIPYAQKVKGLVDIFASWDPHHKRIYYRFYDWKNAYILIDYFEWLLNTIFQKEEIYIILDGWSVHKSYAVKTFAALNPRLHLVPLPSCSSWMNAIERIFSRVQVEVLDNSNFQSATEAICIVSSFLEKELNSS